MRKWCHSLKIFRLVVLLALAGCAKIGNGPSAPRDSRVLWITDESWSDNTGKDLGTTQHRLLTGAGLVRFGGVGASRRVVPFLASEWDSSDDVRWKFVVAPFFDSEGHRVSVPELAEELRDRLEARATPCGVGTKEVDLIGQVLQRTLPGACEARRFRLLPDALTASADGVTFRTALPAPWLPWLLAQASLWVGAPERFGQRSWGEFRWRENGSDRRRYGRNANFAAFSAAAGAAKLPQGPVRELDLDVRVVKSPTLRAAHVEEGNADLIDGVEATWARSKTSRLVEKDEGFWLVTHHVAQAALDCDLLSRQTGERWVAVDEAERVTAKFLLGEAPDDVRRALPLPEGLREALGAQAYVAALDANPKGSVPETAPTLAGFSVFGFSGTALASLPSGRGPASAARCSRRRYALRGPRLDEWRAGVWEPGAGWNLAADTSGTPSAVLYGQDYWPVDKR